ncbi:uncharacterized protein DUF3822 [Spirosoma oryzae]|uniref:Uncharacterized protein DUF3822 n=1 Tax=Spirosoma oryzae TaxID=1469603 RepID=A0A2T0SUI1_9BACT|nr:DUF3822 family protein [Spirosoma oryzae]PRY37077.1 uncharacterized protein DUF3822 [Spirosoma oryzae]
MPTPTISIRSDQFGPEHSARAVLCLEAGHDRFRFMAMDGQGRGQWLEDYAFPSLLTERAPTDLLTDIFRDHPLLTAGPWHEIRISINTPSFTLVPQPLYRKEYAGSYLALMRGNELPAYEFAQAYRHESEGFLSVFSLSHALADFFSEAYPLQPMTFVHQAGALLEATAALSKQASDESPVYLYFEDEFVTVISRAGGKLTYCNRFGYKNAQDLTYYVLYILTELSINPETVVVMLYGEITPFAEQYTELSRFLAHLRFGTYPTALTLSDDFSDLPDHRYLSLYGLCLMGD